MALMVYQILFKSMHEKIVCICVLWASVFCVKKKNSKKDTNISGVCI